MSPADMTPTSELSPGRPGRPPPPVPSPDRVVVGQRAKSTRPAGLPTRGYVSDGAGSAVIDHLRAVHDRTALRRPGDLAPLELACPAPGDVVLVARRIAELAQLPAHLRPHRADVAVNLVRPRLRRPVDRAVFEVV